MPGCICFFECVSESVRVCGKERGREKKGGRTWCSRFYIILEAVRKMTLRQLDEALDVGLDLLVDGLTAQRTLAHLLSALPTGAGMSTRQEHLPTQKQRHDN